MGYAREHGYVQHGRGNYRQFYGNANAIGYVNRVMIQLLNRIIRNHPIFLPPMVQLLWMGLAVEERATVLKVGTIVYALNPLRKRHVMDVISSKQVHKIMKKVVNVAVYLILCILAEPSYSVDDRQNIEKYLRDIVVLNNADNIYYSQHNNSAAQLSFLLKEKYPAEKAIEELSEKLLANGWSPLKEDYLNQGVLSSHSEGWSKFEDWSSTPNQMIYQWIGDWQDAERNTIRTAFIYTKLIDENLDNSILKVHIIYWSSGEVRSDRIKLESVK